MQVMFIKHQMQERLRAIDQEIVTSLEADRLKEEKSAIDEIATHSRRFFAYANKKKN